MRTSYCQMDGEIGIYMTCFYKSYYLSRANELCLGSGFFVTRWFESVLYQYIGLFLLESNRLKRSFYAPSTFSHNYIWLALTKWLPGWLGLTINWALCHHLTYHIQIINTDVPIFQCHLFHSQQDTDRTTVFNHNFHHTKATKPSKRRSVKHLIVFRLKMGLPQSSQDISAPSRITILL